MSHARARHFSLASLAILVLEAAILLHAPLAGSANQAGLLRLYHWLISSPPLLGAVAGFLALLVVVHLAYFLLLYLVYRSATARMRNRGRSLLLILGFQAVAFLLLLALNRRLYPRSLFSWSAEPLFTDHGEAKLLLLAAIFTGFVVSALVAWRPRWRSTPLWARGLILFVLAGGVAAKLTDRAPSARPAVDGGQPNVILIGIDSLHPALVSPEVTPTLAQATAAGLRFENAFTPLGRTFPAWVSILTGKDPVHHGARFNLTASSRIDRSGTLAKDLKRAGYRTLFFMDEKRFANIDEGYGFDVVGGPPMGLRDFLLGPLGDLPLLNLLRQLPPARHLLPDSYANRAVAGLYEPKHFDRLLREAIDREDSRPLFLAVHFCLPHWPYHWATSDDYPTPPNPTALEVDTTYLKALHRADRQVAGLLEHLRRRGLLNHAIVVFLSDHPEAFAGFAPRTAVSSTKGRIELHARWGHGAQVDHPEASRILLAFTGHGVRGLPDEAVTEAVSLVDIRPTILDLLGLEAPDTMDGHSLLKGREQPLYLETGLRVTQFTSPDIDQNKVVEAGIGYFETVPSTGRLALKADNYDELVATKSYAVVAGGKLLALNRTASGEYDRVSLRLIPSPIPPPAGMQEQGRMERLLCRRFAADPGIGDFCNRSQDDLQWNGKPSRPASR